MAGYLAFLVAVLSVSVYRHDGFADGFSVVSRVRTSALQSPLPLPLPLSVPVSESSVSTLRTNSRIKGSRPVNSNTQARTRRTRLFSQTTKQKPLWFCQEAPAPQATSTSSQSSATSLKSTTSSISPSISPSKSTASKSVSISSSKSTASSSTKPAPKTVFNASKFAITKGPDKATKPDYENIHGPLGKTIDNIFLYVFRSKLAEHVGVDSKLPKTDFSGLIELSAAMNARYSDRNEIQNIAQQTLRSLFPSWLPGQFAILFARPFPEFSSRMNAWATYVAGQWLMGECEINDIEIDGKIMKDQGLLVKRCRFLEESGCASICVNSCKIPTQQFFNEDMGLPLTMTPDYETHECQFSFGRVPTEQDDLDAMGTPCLSRCPTAGSMRQWHNGSKGAATNAARASGQPPLEIASSQCAFMENPSGNDDEDQRLLP